MQKLLVTGASGFLGWNLCQYAQTSWEVYGTYYSHKVEIPEVTLAKVDLRDFNALQELFQEVQPHAVIHTAAASKPDFCQIHPEESYSINVTASLNIAHLCGESNIPCAFTSTDLVFDGQGRLYKETDPVSPVTIYGEQKVKAEQKMLEIYPAIALCRMPLMFGLAPSVSPSMIQGMIGNLRKGKELNLFTDEFRTPTSATSAAQGLLLAIDKKVGGILHLGGRERISRYDFGLLLADIFQLSKELIKPGKQADIDLPAPRSPDTSLDSNKAFALGYHPLALKDELTQLKINNL